MNHLYVRIVCTDQLKLKRMNHLYVRRLCLNISELHFSMEDKD